MSIMMISFVFICNENDNTLLMVICIIRSKGPCLYNSHSECKIYWNLLNVYTVPKGLDSKGNTFQQWTIYTQWKAIRCIQCWKIQLVLLIYSFSHQACTRKYLPDVIGLYFWPEKNWTVWCIGRVISQQSTRL